MERQNTEDSSYGNLRYFAAVRTVSGRIYEIIARNFSGQVWAILLYFR